MGTFIYLFSELLIFTLVVFAFYKLLKSEKTTLFTIFSITLLINIYLISEAFNSIHLYLRELGIFIQLGHSSIIDLLIWGLSTLVSIILIIFFGFFQNQKNEK